LIPDIEKCLPVAIFKMAATIPQKFNIVRFLVSPCSYTYLLCYRLTCSLFYNDNSFRRLSPCIICSFTLEHYLDVIRTMLPTAGTYYACGLVFKSLFWQLHHIWLAGEAVNIVLA
jgi:hypothetical protein